MFSGQLVDPLNLKVSDIRADDIAWALAHINRYGGHAHRAYSVGEHTLDVFKRAKKFEALLHDAAEAYLGDIPSPLKRRWPAFQAAEDAAQRVIARAFGLDPDGFVFEIEEGATKRADVEAGDYERGTLWTDRAKGVGHWTPACVAYQLFSLIKSFTHPRFHTSLHLDKNTI